MTEILSDVDREIAENEAAFADSGILSEVAVERARQRAKWGIQSVPDGTAHPDDWQVAEFHKATTDHNAQDGTLTWRDILLEEVFEAIAEGGATALREELVQTAAVAVAWISDIDARSARGC
jgi:hypothetical protein